MINMKKLFMILAMVLPVCLFSGCSDDDEFKIDVNALYGKWELREVFVDGKWYDVTKYPYTRFGAEITFFSNGNFYGDGYFGYGSGKYEVKGNTINTYLNGELYLRYNVSSLSGNFMEGTMSEGGSNIKIRAEKTKRYSD